MKKDKYLTQSVTYLNYHFLLIPKSVGFADPPVGRFSNPETSEREGVGVSKLF